ncbi:hypothetical protein L1887_46496 [Cichorium endivia]|nr:hypothetical protein L1887_46496 [Cichorium endivia]
MSQDKREQQLQADFSNLLEIAFRAVHVHQQAHQQRGNENPKQAGCRCRADRGRNVPSRQRGKGNGGLHGSRQNTEIQETGVERRVDVNRRPPGKQHSEDWEQNERAAHHPEVQPPVATARDNGFAGEFCAVHKEQQCDGGRRQSLKKRDESPARREERGQ